MSVRKFVSGKSSKSEPDRQLITDIDKGLRELATNLAVILLKLSDLKVERERLVDNASLDCKSLLYNRYMRHEYTDRFWAKFEKFIALPAQSTDGLRVKAHTIELLSSR
jgi:hypothetical protein